jgi:hypothetical protein
MDTQTLKSVPGLFTEVSEVRWTALLVRQNSKPHPCSYKNICGMDSPTGTLPSRESHAGDQAHACGIEPRCRPGIVFRRASQIP